MFFFDEYTNLYVNGGKTDFVWDYSRWAEQAFREYLRDCRKLTHRGRQRRYGRKLAIWEELKLPLPLPKEQRAADRRPEWLDFLDFKLGPHPAAVLPRCDPRDPQARAGYEILRLRSVCGRVSARP